jgi:hypothetical protein
LKNINVGLRSLRRRTNDQGGRSIAKDHPGSADCSYLIGELFSTNHEHRTLNFL